MTTIAERVAKGAAHLDGREPGWDKRIDLSTLDLRASCRCVLGQLATDTWDDGWTDILYYFGLSRTEWGIETPQSDVAHGFNAGGDQTDADYAELTAEWKRVITARREAPHA